MLPGTPAAAPFLLLHGFGGSARNFRPQARALRNRHRVILFDARGHSRSEAPFDPDEYGPRAFVDDVHRVVTEEAGTAGVILGGLSMGAGIALCYALVHPERVRALVLAGFPPPGDPSPDGWALRFADAIERLGLDEAGAEFVWGGERFDDAAKKLIRRGFLEHAPHALAHILRRVIAVQPAVEDLAPELRKIDVPARVLVGERDRPSRGPSERLAALLPAARLVVIAGAGHIVNLEKPELFNAHLDDLSSELQQSSGASEEPRRGG